MAAEATSAERALTNGRAVWTWCLAGVLLIAAFAASLVLLPDGRFIIPDLGVYQQGAGILAGGGNPYGIRLGFPQTPYTYPPFSLLVFLPLAHAQISLNEVALVNTVLLALAIWAVLRSYPSPRRSFVGISAAQGAFGAAVLLLAQFLQPIRANITFGQINVVLMAVVLIDLLAVPLRGRGILTGIAAMIKLTPLIFVVYMAWVRQRGVALRFLAAVVGCLAVSILVLPGLTGDYFTRGMIDQNLPGRTYPGAPTNQSLRAMVLRWLGPGLTDPGPVSVGARVELVWLGLCLLVLVALLLSLLGLQRDRDEALGLCYVSLAGLLISPVSWSHHWVWVVPLAVAVGCSWRWYPLMSVPALVMVVAMLGQPWFITHLQSMPVQSNVATALLTNAYVLAASLSLVVASWYGVLRLRRDRAVGNRRLETTG